ncbi:MAG TPA: thiol:disulfide interchange protein DsbA/DsbL [SAR86 cluster bacterium]|nr:thiol:disulfide interchange protein DsbA/DsbL [SAR86 cluster bacterium]|tara:strand:+ start:8730 stop:9398 length:669 start_codon:yes stop_codon:yes gene_type:complete
MLLRNLSITLLSLFLLSCTSEEENEVHSLANDDKFKSGVHYELIDNPSTVRDPSKIEVIEVFWFGCNHCYALEPYLIRWKKDLPKDVAFSKSPATWNEILKIHARIYYTAKALGIEQQFIPAAFNTIQNEGRRLTGNTELEYFFKGFNVDREKYKSVSKSFGVNNALDQADKKMKQWEVTGVPALIVNGKYRVSASRAVGTDSLFDVVNFLIEKERKYSATK